MPEYKFKDLKPFEDNTIEHKIENSKNYAKILLYVNLKGKENPSSVTAREIMGFFGMEQSYVFRILQFFTDNGLLRKIKQSTKLVYYIPIPKEIARYVDAAYKKSKEC